MTLTLQRGFWSPADASPFDPATLTPDLWLDPSDLATLFKTSAGTGAVTTDGDIVKYMGDKGAGVNHVKQAGLDAISPHYKTAAGLRWIDFDGNDYLTGTAISSFMGAAVADILIAGNLSVVTTDSINIESDESIFSDTGGYCGLGFRTSNGMNAWGYDSAEKRVPDAYTPANDFVAHYRHNGGVLSLTQNARSTVTVAMADQGLITGNLRVGGNYSAGMVMTGRFYGMIARKTIFDATALANLKTWLGAKAGLLL